VHLGGKTGAVLNLDNIHVFDTETEVVIRDNPPPHPDAYKVSKAHVDGGPH
jgi:hypothetical protein